MGTPQQLLVSRDAMCLTIVMPCIHTLNGASTLSILICRYSYEKDDVVVFKKEVEDSPIH